MEDEDDSKGSKRYGCERDAGRVSIDGDARLPVWNRIGRVDGPGVGWIDGHGGVCGALLEVCDSTAESCSLPVR